MAEEKAQIELDLENEVEVIEFPSRKKSKRLQS